MELAPLNAPLPARAVVGPGRAPDAEEHYRTALAATGKVAGRYAAARAHDGLAHLRAEAGDRPAARRLWLDVLDTYAALGVAEAGHVRDRLVD
ncbi:hypothetical protein [Amycolatopsis sp. cmx-8-4]|uniref:hypothetical protein n=1 Tax=Amycolatopsis sp. cmx-8-4 TaxID=2790947 RepID=UPI00397A2C2D